MLVLAPETRISTREEHVSAAEMLVSGPEMRLSAAKRRILVARPRAHPRGTFLLARCVRSVRRRACAA